MSCFVGGVDPRNILYFCLMLRRGIYNRVIRDYEEKILHDKIRGKKIYISMDEVHSLEDWMD